MAVDVLAGDLAGALEQALGLDGRWASLYLMLVHFIIVV